MAATCARKRRRLSGSAHHMAAEAPTRPRLNLLQPCLSFEDATTTCLSCDIPICSCLVQMLTPPPDDGGIDLPATTTATITTSVTATTTAPAGEKQCDWTAALPQTDHIRFFRNTDWSRTRLGPLDSWSPTLRLFATYVLVDSHAACLWWGDDVSRLTAIYNDSYAPLAAGAHPRLMGSLFQDGYPELWPSIRRYFEQAKRTGTGISYSSDESTLVERKGYREEAFFSGSFIPVGIPGAVQGYTNTVFEVTAQKLAERRTRCMNKLSSVPHQSVDTVCSHILATLETNSRDVPMAMLYRMDESPGSNLLRLYGHMGLPGGHPLLVNTATIDNEEGLIPDMRRTGTDQTVIDYDDRFSFVDWKGWGAPSKKIVFMPIVCGGHLFGYLIVGTNPYRPYDEACEQFTLDLGRMVSAIVAAAMDCESNKKRQDQLEADLAFSDLKLRHLIDHASVGMCHVSLDGYMLWANDHYYELAGKSQEDHAESLAFFDAYHEDDRAKAEEVWERLIRGDDQITVDLRLKRLYTPPTGDPEPAQLQVLAFPYRNEHGSVVSVMACTTDISRLCWAKTFQARLAAEAREAKRQQEAFIDVVSHEMRNPLSAIVHCADAIATAVEECQAQIAGIPRPCLDVLNDNMHSANIIMQCAHHQKRIIDDVLTLSKLDSMLLSITPVPVKPLKLVDSIVDIFEAELKINKIAYSVTPDSSFSDLRIDQLCFDPSRVTQIFINLLTNAIKFVKPSKEPAISIRYGASISEPRTLFPSDMFWATDGGKRDDVTSSPDWGDGEEIYLGFSVKDSGIGLQEKDIEKIFERFRQANVKTHVNYGGSGLGLFISKELTEKQGGEIGVCSVFGEGSTFGFYVKTRRVERKPKTLKEAFQQTENQEFASGQLRVLLVEDNIINQRVLGKQLKKAGCHVTVANHGLEALDSLDRQTFDIVLMDLEMPVLDGLEAMRKFRKKELNRGQPTRLPIIAVTANVRKEQIDTAMAAGADRVMQKPFKAADLVFMMKSLIPQLAPASIDPPTPGLDNRSTALVP